jgi:hypothetical protein
MSRQAAGAPKGGPHIRVSGARAMTILVIAAVGLAVIGAMVLLLLQQLQAD